MNLNDVKRKAHTFFHTPRIIMKKFAKSKLFALVPDRMAIKIVYKNCFLKAPNLKNPQTFNEKLQWLKLYDRNPKYSNYVDKYKAKKIIANVLGEEYVIPNLGVWDSFDEINFDELPEQFVLKCNHGSGDVLICKDKQTFDKEKARRILTRDLKKDYSIPGREWPYRGVERKIIAEKYMTQPDGGLDDYKFFCFDGNVDCVMVVKGRAAGDTKFYYCNREWEILPYGRLTRSLPKGYTIPKPDNIERMFEIAETLSQDFPHVRIDLYNIEGKIYFGEYTLYSAGGVEVNFDAPTEKHLGDLIVLPDKNKYKRKKRK